MDALGRSVRLAVAGLVIAGGCLFAATAAGAASPQVAISPAGPYHDGETVTVSVAASPLFTPETKVNILECADPGGTVANLPTDNVPCDGQTIQAGTLYVGASGAVTERAYTLYQLPSAALGEQQGWNPVCDTTHPCVLFIGVAQDNFSLAHTFSAPFSIEAGTSSANSGTVSTTSTLAPAGSSPNTSTVATADTSSSAPPSTPGAASSGSESAAVTLGGSSGTLAFTGVSFGLIWPAALGVVLILIGSAGRRRLARGVVFRGMR
jgi:hypothetical protein